MHHSETMEMDLKHVIPTVTHGEKNVMIWALWLKMELRISKSYILCNEIFVFIQ